MVNVIQLMSADVSHSSSHIYNSVHGYSYSQWRRFSHRQL